jgi:hypothetical protein
MQFDKYPPERQQYVLKDLAYKNYEYDVYNLAKYLTNGVQEKSVNFNEPLIKKPLSNIVEKEVSILNVEPQIEESDGKEENSNNNSNNDNSNNDNNDNNDNSSKKVSFDTSSSDTNSNSNSSSTTKKITL